MWVLKHFETRCSMCGRDRWSRASGPHHRKTKPNLLTILTNTLMCGYSDKGEAQVSLRPNFPIFICNFSSTWMYSCFKKKRTFGCRTPSQLLLASSRTLLYIFRAFVISANESFVRNRSRRCFAISSCYPSIGAVFVLDYLFYLCSNKWSWNNFFVPLVQNIKNFDFYLRSTS